MGQGHRELLPTRAPPWLSWSQHRQRWGRFSCAKPLVGACSGSVISLVDLCSWVWGRGSGPTSYTAGPEGCRLAQVPWASSGTEGGMWVMPGSERAFPGRSGGVWDRHLAVTFVYHCPQSIWNVWFILSGSFFKMKRHTVPGHLNPQGQYTFTEFLLDRGRLLTGTGFQGLVKTPCGLWRFHVAPPLRGTSSINTGLPWSK